MGQNAIVHVIGTGTMAGYMRQARGNMLETLAPVFRQHARRPAAAVLLSKRASGTAIICEAWLKTALADHPAWGCERTLLTVLSDEPGTPRSWCRTSSQPAATTCTLASASLGSCPRTTPAWL